MPLVSKPNNVPPQPQQPQPQPPPHGSSSVRTSIRDFSSQWFLTPQGTAITATVLHQLDYRFPGLIIIAYTFWATSILLLLLMLTLYAARLTLHRTHTIRALKHDDAELAGLASISITFTSVTQTASLALAPDSGNNNTGGPWSATVHILWWISFALATITILILPFISIKVYPPGVAHLSPSTQLALTAALTAAAAGGTLCTSAANLTSTQQVPIIVARLLGNNEPPKEKAFQDMILCEPWGQASYALQILGQAVIGGSFASYTGSGALFSADAAAAPVGYPSIFAGLVAWGLGTYWWLFAILGVFRAFFAGGWKPNRIPYTLAGWAMVFPWGVYTNAVLQLGKIFGSRAFKMWSTCLAVIAGLCITE
ncbi:voltage-dependent anion channel [Colletotrichum godetiae]|uniref:Voltage-dependent anion channel n=1 Tax=Colletotrichum godetiae TaxID=1209918 RepID=A0AAJ0ANG0_9PEZI|nr:voltage-dependent anion channel [Colletotrichum godetiae]KAK1676469.1 voltage-dependent anion channel [Colletotrichum godetiae]